MENTTIVIHVEGLTKTYGSLAAVDAISFDVHCGEIFGIVGPNGAGKTTLVECLAGLRRPDGGTVQVLGLDPQTQSQALRQRIGVQLQQAALPEDIKVWEALNLFASFYRHAVDWQPLIEEWGLAEKRTCRFSKLSGGQKQRLFIALALINEPELVFLDELTTGLDPQARRSTWELVNRLRDGGKTVILVTHYMEEAEHLCDRVAIIDHGKLIALDRPAALVKGLQAESRLRFTASNSFKPESLQRVSGVSKVLREGDEVLVYGHGALLVNVVSALAEQGVAPANLTSEQATLEDVFLALTGNKIRD